MAYQPSWLKENLSLQKCIDGNTLLSIYIRWSYVKQKIYSKAFFYSNCFWAIPLLFLLSTPMSIPSNYDQQLRTTGHPPILIARLIRESKPNGKRWIDEWIYCSEIYSFSWRWFLHHLFDGLGNQKHYSNKLIGNK